jgi:hypothetical protein
MAQSSSQLCSGAFTSDAQLNTPAFAAKVYLAESEEMEDF